MTEIIEKIKLHKERNHRVRLFRQVSKNKTETSNGYILDFSNDLILIQESDDFKVDGFAVFPINQIKKIRYNKSDKYFDQMMVWEKESEKVGMKYHVDLTNWTSVFKSLQTNEKYVIAECEAAEIESFTIGPIVKAGRKYVHILYFDAEGYFQNEPSSIDYKSITRVAFDTQYLNIFSKYTRHKKV